MPSMCMVSGLAWPAVSRGRRATMSEQPAVSPGPDPAGAAREEGARQAVQIAAMGIAIPLLAWVRGAGPPSGGRGPGGRRPAGGADRGDGDRDPAAGVARADGLEPGRPAAADDAAGQAGRESVGAGG